MPRTKRLLNRTLYRVRLHKESVKRLIAMLGRNAPALPTNSEAIDVAVCQTVRVMSDENLSVVHLPSMMAHLNGHLQRQRIEDAQALAASVGATMWVQETETGLKLEFRINDTRLGDGAFLPDKTFAYSATPPAHPTVDRTADVTRH